MFHTLPHKAVQQAPRVTLEDIHKAISHEDYYVFPGTTVTVCCLTLTNGFNVIGESACASPENFDPDLGRKLAFERAREKVWPLEGYLLKSMLHERLNQLKVIDLPQA
jgi:hypothetical protein